MNMNRILLFLLLAPFAFIVACSSQKNKIDAEIPEQVELPPSLKSETEMTIVKLTSQQQQDLHIKITPVNSRLVDYSLSAPGVVFPAPKHSSIISTPINGQVSEIKKYEGDWVREGEVLYHIQSLEFGNLVSEYLQAYAEKQFQTNRLKRIRQLVEETISSVSEMERVTAEFERASASERAAYSKLKALGVTDREMQTFIGAENITPVLQIHCPIGGMVDQTFVELGQSVSALENLSRVLDTQEVLIRGYVSPDEARLINNNDSVRISRRDEALGSTLHAKIASINPGLEENSRSVVVNILTEAVDGWPRPGENVRLEIITSSKKEVIAIPVEALTYDGNQAVIFVKKGQGIFEKRPITVSEIGAKHVFVQNGLSDNEQVASSNVFSLKALSRYDIISEE